MCGNAKLLISYRGGAKNVPPGSLPAISYRKINTGKILSIETKDLDIEC